MSMNSDNAKPVVAIIQARMNSTRLPGKVMKETGGRTLLGHVVNRLSRSGRIDKIVVATSTDRSDDVIDRWCTRDRTRCFRGSLTDVLGRYYWAARAYGARTIVRVTADCPLIDAEVVDTVIDRFLSGPFDYARTDETYPNGLDAEVFSLDALLKAFNEAELASEREHVTPYIWKNPESFRASRVLCPEDLSAMRWTVDDRKDLAFVDAVFEGIGKGDGVFPMKRILEYLDANPGLARINAGTRRNEGYEMSLREEAMVKAC
ncbi:MAG: cytidylyltransferase domain-containing protein [Thermodesulfobacteriota bacterium]